MQPVTGRFTLLSAVSPDPGTIIELSKCPFLPLLNWLTKIAFLLGDVMGHCTGGIEGTEIHREGIWVPCRLGDPRNSEKRDREKPDCKTVL